MSGSNGLSPITNLAERQKCPKHPSKRRYSNSEEALAAAAESSRKSGLTIEPYMCDACGFYHLTKSTGGSTVHLPDGKFSVGEFRAKAPDHPVFSGGNEPEPEPPLVPGDHKTRVRFAREFLITNPTPTSAELCEALGGCTKDTLRKVMHELGYVNTRGRHARWVPAEQKPEPTPEPEEDTRPVLDLSYDNDAPDEPSAVWHGGREVPRSTTRQVGRLDALRHIPLGDLIDTYKAAGFTLVITLE